MIPKFFTHLKLQPQCCGCSKKHNKYIILSSFCSSSFITNDKHQYFMHQELLPNICKKYYWYLKLRTNTFFFSKLYLKIMSNKWKNEQCLMTHNHLLLTMIVSWYRRSYKQILRSTSCLSTHTGTSIALATAWMEIWKGQAQIHIQ